MLDGEASIIKQAVGGESSAFGHLYDHYVGQIYRFIRVKVSSREEAEDLTHQVFLHAWDNIQTYKDLGHPFSSWLYRIARNAVIDHYRTRKDAVTFNEEAHDVADLVSVSDSIQLKMDTARVMAAIRKLKHEQQDVVIMRFIEELSIKETSQILGKTEGAIKLIQHRAIKELRSLLDLPPEFETSLVKLI